MSLAGILQGGGAVLYLIAFSHATVATVMLTQSTGPLFAAGLASLLFRDHLGRLGLYALPVIVLGLAVMAFDGVRAGNALGMSAALGNTVLFALFLVIIRRSPAGGLLPTLMIGAVAGAILAAFLADGLSVTLHDLAFLALWGGVVQTVGLALVAFSSRRLHAAEISFLGTLEFILGPLWVWLDRGESPNPLSAAGGLIVFITVLIWLAFEFRSVHRLQARTCAPRLTPDEGGLGNPPGVDKT